MQPCNPTAHPAGTRAHVELQDRPGTPGDANALESVKGCQDGRTAYPRYSSTFEKPGFSGHIPEHVDSYGAGTGAPPLKVARDVPG